MIGRLRDRRNEGVGRKGAGARGGGLSHHVVRDDGAVRGGWNIRPERMNRTNGANDRGEAITSETVRFLFPYRSRS